MREWTPASKRWRAKGMQKVAGYSTQGKLLLISAFGSSQMLEEVRNRLAIKGSALIRDWNRWNCSLVFHEVPGGVVANLDTTFEPWCGHYTLAHPDFTHEYRLPDRESVGLLLTLTVYLDMAQWCSTWAPSFTSHFARLYEVALGIARLHPRADIILDVLENEF